MIRIAAIILLLAMSFGCKEQPSYMTVSEPSAARGNERAFVEYVLAHLSPTLDQVTCHCCKKTLKHCLGEMGTGASGACPFT